MPQLPHSKIYGRIRTALLASLVSTVALACSSREDTGNKAEQSKAKKESPPSNEAAKKKQETVDKGKSNSESKTDAEADSRARAIIPEIAEGIKKHIAKKSQEDGGLFKLPHGDKTLQLKLVRVHIEYLAALDVDRNFACVDLVDVDGEVYDVDFFLSGPPDDMKVTETTVHKLNGKPMYAWEQKDDGTWHRVPMDKASAKLQGVIEGEDQFEFFYNVELPKMDQEARMWLPIPLSDKYQEVELVSLEAPGKQTEIEDKENINKILMLDLSPEDSGKEIKMRFSVKRKERGPEVSELKDRERYLREDKLVPITDEMRKLAHKAIEGKDTDLIKARALYDHVMDRMAYKKVGDDWGQGDAVYACDSRTGNCSDYHSYFIAIARAVGIPARFAVGAAIPSSRDDGGVNGYHCWAEFYADGKWWPIDVSEGDKYSNLSTYYFGHHPANRFEFSRGRDLNIEPSPKTGPINFLAHPAFEVGDEYVRIKGKFSFLRKGKKK